MPEKIVVFHILTPIKKLSIIAFEVINYEENNFSSIMRSDADSLRFVGFCGNKL